MCEWGTETVIEIGGRPRDIDACLADLVRALNDGGVATVACCCGHGQMDGSILLADGRCLVIMDRAGHDAHFAAVPVTIHGEPRPIVAAGLETGDPGAQQAAPLPDGAVCGIEAPLRGWLRCTRTQGHDGACWHAGAQQAAPLPAPASPDGPPIRWTKGVL